MQQSMHRPSRRRRNIAATFDGTLEMLAGHLAAACDLPDFLKGTMVQTQARAQSAGYTRQQQNASISYTLVSSKLAAGLDSAISSFGFFFFAVIGLFFAIGIGNALSLTVRTPLMFLVVVGAYIYLLLILWRRNRKTFEAKKVNALGRRGTFMTILTPSQISVRELSETSQSSQEVAVERANVRRVRVINTLDKIDASGQQMSTAAMVAAQPNPYRASALLAAQSIGNARRAKARATCFAVALDYSNTSTLLADGLDELTAQNFYDDLMSDLNSSLVISE